MEELASLGSVVNLIGLVILGIAVKYWISRAEQRGGELGKVDAQLVRLRDLVSIDSGRLDATEKITQPNRVRLAFSTAFIERKLDAYSGVLLWASKLHQHLMRTGDQEEQLIDFVNDRDRASTSFSGENVLYLSCGVHRATRMLATIPDDVQNLINRKTGREGEIVRLRERSRLACELLMIEMAEDLNRSDVAVFAPTQEAIDRWVSESRDLDRLRQEVKARGTPSL